MRLAFPGLVAALAEGATIVTPTPLLASVAIEQFNRSQLARGNDSWENGSGVDSPGQLQSGRLRMETTPGRKPRPGVRISLPDLPRRREPRGCSPHGFALMRVVRVVSLLSKRVTMYTLFVRSIMCIYAFRL